MGKWCILRTSGGSTLPLARSLTDAGFEVWTPVEEQRRCRPRSSIRYDITVPIMPTYVFANADRLGDLIALSGDPVSPHRGFSVFRYFNRYPLISDRTLDPLRIAERQGRPLEEVARFSPGDRVKVIGAGFDGLSGIVEVTKGKFTMVCFPGFQIPIKISAWQLLPVNVTGSQPEQGTAA